MIIKFDKSSEYNDFKESIKVNKTKSQEKENYTSEKVKNVTKEEKEKIMRNAILMMFNSTNVLSIEEMVEKNNDIGLKLEDDEIIAIHSLAEKLKIAFTSAKLDERMLDVMSGKGLLEFIQESVKDIRTFRDFKPNSKWDLSMNKIFYRMDNTKANKEHD